MYILHGHAGATCTSRVLVVLYQLGYEQGKDFKVAQIQDFGDIKTPEWLTHQPFGQMPWFEDTEAGIELFESRAIIRYIANKASSSLIANPSSPERYAKFEEAYQVEQSQFDPSASKLVAELVFAKMHGRETNQATVDAQTPILADKLKVYETILSTRKYLAGDELTLADLSHLPYGHIASKIGVAPGLTDGTLPNVTRWWKSLVELESWNKVLEGGYKF